MRTTLLNPTLWLLGATLVAAVVGIVRRRSARESLESVLRYACLAPVLAAIVLLSAFNVGSRAVLGFLAPGAYAEEVVAARSFLQERQLYDADPRRELEQWTAGSKVPNKEKVGKVTRKQVMDIVKMKKSDMNATSDEAAFRVVSGTARSMGIEVVG